MSDPIRPYEPLTSENAALVLVDHQVGLMTGVRDYSTGELKHNVVALAKAAKALKLPIIVTTTARDSMWGPTFPELVEALPGVPIIDRSSVNAFDDPNVAQAIATTGRKKLIFAGNLPRSLRGVPCHHRGWQGPPCLCGRRRLRNVWRDQTTSRSSAHAAGRRDRLGLREPDGGNPERQRTTRGRRRVRCNGHALGEARGADCARLRQVNDAGSAGGRFWARQ
jgi:Isochorismatase family